VSPDFLEKVHECVWGSGLHGVLPKSLFALSKTFFDHLKGFLFGQQPVHFSLLSGFVEYENTSPPLSIMLFEKTGLPFVGSAVL
jgi:hypothetical protein